MFYAVGLIAILVIVVKIVVKRQKKSEKTVVTRDLRFRIFGPPKNTAGMF